ncbi:hypothetical protein RDI58_024640 [Solanum bulbocastanum]|jgi:hypothetical protein
MGCT